MSRDMTVTSKKLKRHEPFDWEKEYLELMDDAWDDKYVYDEGEYYGNLFDGLHQEEKDDEELLDVYPF